MPTTAQKFYPCGTDHSGTWGTDVYKLLDVAAGSVDTSTADFGTDTAAGTIVIDPFTVRTTRGTTNEADFGWAVNAAGADGMASTSSALRIIPTGTWTFQCQLSVTVAQTGTAGSTTTLTAVVYRVSSAGGRTELFRQASAATTVTALTGVGVQAVSWTSSQSLITLQANETILVSYQIASIGVAVTGQRVTFLTIGNGADAANCWVQVPPPGVRTNYPQSITVTGVGTALRQALAAAHAVQTVGVGTATVGRHTEAAKAISVTAVGTVARSLRVTAKTITTTAVGTVTGKIEVPLERLPGAGDFSGASPTKAITGTVFDEGGAPYSGATVKLFRQSDDLKVASTTSAADGTYTFTRDAEDPNSYYVLAFTGTTPQVHGVSDRDVLPE